ncbi:MAG: hypothetical protein ABI629_08740 [bacterium]
MPTASRSAALGAAAPRAALRAVGNDDLRAALAARTLRQAARALPGYDVSRLGCVVARVG